MHIVIVLLNTYPGSILQYFIFFKRIYRPRLWIWLQYVCDIAPKACLKASCTTLFFIKLWVKLETCSFLHFFKGNKNPIRVEDSVHVHYKLWFFSREDKGYTKERDKVVGHLGEMYTIHLIIVVDFLNRQSCLFMNLAWKLCFFGRWEWGRWKWYCWY